MIRTRTRTNTTYSDGVEASAAGSSGRASRAVSVERGGMGNRRARVCSTFRKILHVTELIMPLIVVAESIVVFWWPRIGPLVLELNASQGLVSNSLLSRIDFKDECVDNCVVVAAVAHLSPRPLTQPHLLCARHICRARQPNG